jgi:hypothetical protein
VHDAVHRSLPSYAYSAGTERLSDDTCAR